MLADENGIPDRTANQRAWLLIRSLCPDQGCDLGYKGNHVNNTTPGIDSSQAYPS